LQCKLSIISCIFWYFGAQGNNNNKPFTFGLFVFKISFCNHSTMCLEGCYWQRLQQFLADQCALRRIWLVHCARGRVECGARYQGCHEEQLKVKTAPTIHVWLLQWKKTASVNHTFPPTQSVASEEIHLETATTYRL